MVRNFLRRANLDFDKFDFHGFIISWPDVMSVHKDSATFTIETNSAWQPIIKMWQAIAQTFSDEISIIYTSEEPGLGDYYTNDSSMIGKYIVNTYSVEEHESLKDTIFYEEAEEIYSEEDLRTNLLKVYHEDCHKDLSTDQLISLICKDYKGICINQFEFCSINDVG